MEYNKLIQKYSDLLSISASDYMNAENSYKIYIELFDRLLITENLEELYNIKIDIEKENPWGNATLNEDSMFRSVACVDRPILDPLLEKEMKFFQKQYTEELNNIDRIDKVQILKNRFKDFEHAFDGNFENPRVLILGINPKMNSKDHKPYNLRTVYERPFNQTRAILKSDDIKNDYYYSTSNGLFFKGMINKNNETEVRLYNEVCDRMDSQEKITPVALWEFFPYASKSETEWYKGMEIGHGTKAIKNYFNLRSILPSQIWMLCLLTYTIKKSVLSNEKLTIFLKKNNNEFRENFLDQYFKFLNLEKLENINILTKKNGRRKEFSYTNVKPYYKNSQWKESDNVFDFFKNEWDIECRNN